METRIKKTELFKNHGKGITDTGSPESQIALFTTRIIHLTEHLEKNVHDQSTKLALTKLVGKRKRFLEYLAQTDIERYRKIIKELKIRK